ncbi:MAG: serpin family protein [Gemmatimonadota bacterium]|nr:serpin family protein [Gemmatimonadota bacterium]
MIKRFSPILVGVALAACGEFGPIESLPRELSVAETKLVEADNRFALKLFREVNLQSDPGTNVFISPLSVGMALGMTYNGAAGTTRDAMQQALELQGMTIDEVNEAYQSLILLLRELDPSVDFLLANSIWYHEDAAIVPAFLDVTQRYFDAQVTALDFSDPGAADVINAWVNTQTQGRIPDIVTAPIDPELIMYLINAIYFKGAWTYQFDADLTTSRAFTLADGSQTSVPTMTHEDEIPVGVYLGESFTVADLSYGAEAWSMTIVVPRDPTTIDDLASALTQATWNGWVASLDSTESHVLLPKFTLEYEIELNDVLKALGMEIAFDPFQADFSNLYAGPWNAYISEVKHKTFVEVNEEGTEAAAATSVGIGVTSAPRMVLVDRPFLFAIRENLSGTILFMGKIVDPR